MAGVFKAYDIRGLYPGEVDERLGFEVTYWGDTVREPMLARAAREAPGQPLLFGPNLAPFQAPAVEFCSPALVEAEVPIVGWDAGRPEQAAACRLAVVYRRRADLAPLEPLMREAEVLAEYRIQGVWLARLVRQRGSAPHPPRGEPSDKTAGRVNTEPMAPRRTGVID